MAGSFFLVYLWIDIQTDLRFKNGTSVTLEDNSEAYSKPCQTSKMEVSTKIVNGFSFLTIFVKIIILDVWQDSEFPCKPRKGLRKKLHLRCLAGSWIHLCFNYFRKTFAYLFTTFDQHIPPYISKTVLCTVKSTWP